MVISEPFSHNLKLFPQLLNHNLPVKGSFLSEHSGSTLAATFPSPEPVTTGTQAPSPWEAPVTRWLPCSTPCTPHTPVRQVSFLFVKWVSGRSCPLPWAPVIPAILRTTCSLHSSCTPCIPQQCPSPRNHATQECTALNICRSAWDSGDRGLSAS